MFDVRISISVGNASGSRVFSIETKNSTDAGALREIERKINTALNLEDN